MMQETKSESQTRRVGSAGATAKNHKDLAVTPLKRDVGCGNSLNWRCDLRCRPVVSSAETLFVEAGYRSLSALPALKVFRHPGGHEIAWVVRTGRVQIRISSVVAVSEREKAASEMYRKFVDILSRSFAETPEPLMVEPSVRPGAK
jgi:hypothetical protein